MRLCVTQQSLPILKQKNRPPIQKEHQELESGKVCFHYLMNKSEQTGPHRSLEINLVLLLQVKLCFCSQEQPFPNGQTDPSPSATVRWCSLLDCSVFPASFQASCNEPPAGASPGISPQGTAAVLCHLSTDTTPISSPGVTYLQPCSLISAHRGLWHEQAQET